MSLVVIVICSITYIQGNLLLDCVELKIVDWALKYSKITSTNDIVLADIDEYTLSKEGGFDTRRLIISNIIDKLSVYEAKAVVIDFIFTESSMQYDEELAKSIKKSKPDIICAYFFHFDKSVENHVSPKEITTRSENIKKGLIAADAFEKFGAANNAPIPVAIMPSASIPIISKDVGGLGYSNVSMDIDGSVRSVPGIIKFQENYYVPLSIIAASMYLKIPPKIIFNKYGVESIDLGAIKIPTDDQGQITINYSGRANSFLKISGTDIINGTIPESILKNKIVVVGSSAAGLHDHFVTPISNNLPGMEIQAILLDNILADKCIANPSWVRGATITFIVLFGMLSGAALATLRTLPATLSCMLLSAVYSFLWHFTLLQNGIILNLTYPLLAIFLNLTCCIIFLRYSLEHEKQIPRQGAITK